MLRIHAIHHVQITIPMGQEAAARAFYCDVLGLKEVAKPPSLAGRGGLWLTVGDRQLHIGVESHGDQSVTKAHVAYQVSDITGWRARLEKAGVALVDSAPIPGFQRFEFRDPFGNRVELIQPAS